MSQTFTVVNDEVLESFIRKAHRKIVYVAPGVSARVAKALGERFQELGRLSITLIVDVDPEVYRFGYGDPEGLETIKRLADENFLELRQQPGVRIGLLIADDKTMIYSPTPHLIEAGSTQPEKPNAIVLESTPEAIDQACASGSNSLLSNAEIGKQVVQKEQLEQISKNLKDLPPKKFDVARIERVFNSRIQYVEFKINKYKLSKKIASIPSDLMGLEDNPEILRRWRNAFRMFDGSDKIKVNIPVRDHNGTIKINEGKEEVSIIYSEDALEEERKKIETDFLIKIPGYDVVISRSRREEFNKTIEGFKLRLSDYQKALEKEIEISINKTIEKLVGTLFPSVKKHTPARYLKASFTPGAMSDEELRIVLGEDLREHFGPIKNIAAPIIKLKFKDIAYETIHDPGFREALEKSKIPKRSLKELFSEYDAAPEARQDNQKTMEF